MNACGREIRVPLAIIVVVLTFATSTPVIAQQSPGDSGSGCANTDGMTLQEPQTNAESQPPKSKWEYSGFVDGAYSLDFNHPANHLFRNRGTVFKVDEL